MGFTSRTGCFATPEGVKRRKMRAVTAFCYVGSGEMSQSDGW